MKITATPVKNTTNFDGDVFEATLNTAKLSSVMSILIRNYNSAELATLREWTSNAHDSHQEANQTKPIKITLPTKFSPNLSVEDFGTGMTYDEVRHVYAAFLTSTKDKSNAGIGGFGIGGKSALAIADQYSMVAIKNGLRNVFLFERSDSGGLEVKTVLRDKPTDEHSGVKVTVATNKNWNFRPEQLDSVLEGWRTEELDVVGTDFTSFYSKSLEFKNGLVIKGVFDTKTMPNRQYRGYNRGVDARILVGPVSYPFPEQASRELQQNEKFASFLQATNHQFAIKVGIGKVTFPSSREVIEPTEKNIQVILAAFKKFYDEVEAHVNTRVSSFNSIEEAYVFATSYFVKSSKMTIVYKGRQLTRINYTGIQAFYVERQAATTGIKLFKGSKLEYSASEVDVVIRVDEADSDLSIDTYRKYIRNAVSDHFIASKNSQVHSGSFNILLTRDKDDLHSITSKVFNFTELRALPLVKTGETYKRVNNAEAKSRADREVVLRVVANQATRGHFGDVFKKGTIPILLSSDEDSLPVMHLIGSLFNVQDRVLVAVNKRSIITIKRAYPESLNLAEFMASLPTLEIAKAEKRLKAVSELFKLVDLGRSGVEIINSLKANNLLNENAISIFREELINDFEAFRQFFSRYRYDKKDKAGTYEIFNAYFSTDKFTTRIAGGRVGPFSLAIFQNQSNQDELVAYLNWSADRHLASKA